jgi:hypothetical protein
MNLSTVSGGFSYGEYLTGGTSGAIGYVYLYTSNSLELSTVNGIDFIDGETITTDGGTTATVVDYNLSDILTDVRFGIGGNIKLNNNLALKNGTSINNISTDSGFTTSDDDSIATTLAIKDYISNYTYTSIDEQLIFNSGGTLTGSSNLTFNGDDLSINGYIDSSKMSQLYLTRLESGGDVIYYDNTGITLNSGTGVFWDSKTSTRTEYSWNTTTGITLTGISLGRSSTYLMIDSGGTILQYNDEPKGEQLRKYINLAKISHRGGGDITVIRNFNWYGDEPFLQSADISDALGSLTLEGNEYSPNGNNLLIDKSAGKSYRFNVNTTDNRQNPSITIEEELPGLTFSKVYRHGSGELNFITGQTELDPNYYDDGSGSLKEVFGEFWTIQRIYHFPKSNTTYIHYGQNQYVDETEAEANIRESAELESEFFKAATYRGAIIVKQGTTDLSNTQDALFFNAQKFENPNTSIYEDTVRNQIGLPGVCVNKAYISKVDDSTIDILAGCGKLKKDDGQVYQKNWNDVTGSTIIINDGELRWVTFVWNSGETDLELEYKTTLPITLEEYEKMVLVGRVWKENGTLIVSSYHIGLGLDPTVSRSQAWKYKSFNISVSCGYSDLDSNYLKTLSGELFRWPIVTDHIDSGTIPNHVHLYPGNTQITTMWDHLQDSTGFTLITDNLAGDETDITQISNYYDNSGTITTVPNNKFTIHRLGIYAKSKEIVWLRGQNIYADMNEAEVSISTENFVYADWFSDFGQVSMVCYVIMQQGTTDFSNTSSVKFIDFEVGGGGTTSGGGDVSGEGTSTDNAIVKWDGLSGKLVQDSGILINDNNDITGIRNLSIESGATINNISTDSGFTNSNNTSVATTLAIKNYVDDSKYWSLDSTTLKPEDSGYTINIENDTSSNSPTSGALIVNGGVGISDNLNVSGNIKNEDGSLYIETSTAGSIATFFRSTQAEIKTLNSGNRSGWYFDHAGLSGSIVADDTNYLFDGTWITGDNNEGIGIATDGDVTIQNDLSVNGNTTSTSTSTGALTVGGGVGVGDNLNVSGTISGKKQTEIVSTTSTLIRFNSKVIKQTSSGITTTLWDNPENGDNLIIINRSGGLNIINGNTKTIEGSSTFTLTDGESVNLIYIDSEWLIY